MNHIWVEYAHGKAYAYCKACGQLLGVAVMPDADTVWLAAMRDLDHGCAP